MGGDYDIMVDQGVDFTLPLDMPWDLTGYTARAAIKKDFGELAPTLSFGIVFDADRTTGKLTLTLSASDTLSFDCPGKNHKSVSTYYYDLELTDSTGKKQRPMQGRVLVSPAVTK